MERLRIISRTPFDSSVCCRDECKQMHLEFVTVIIGGIDPSTLGLGGEMPSRRAARAMKAEGRRKQRKAKRKHMRRGRRR